MNLPCAPRFKHYPWSDERSRDLGSRPRDYEAYGQLDFSASYSLGENFSFSIEVLNVTGQQQRITSAPSGLPWGVLENERRIFIGARYRYES